MSETAPNPGFNPVTAPTEELLWKGHTSQWVHFWFYALCLVCAGGIVAASLIYNVELGMVALVIPALAFVIRWWVTKCTSYELTTQRLRKATGVLNRRFDELELFRVKDYSIEQPLLLRIFGLGNVSLITSDSTTPVVNIKAISDVVGLREKIRTAVQHERDRKRVRELDLDGGSAGVL